jgi:hypothetical protein
MRPNGPEPKMVWWEGTAEIPGRIVELTDSMGARIASTAAHNQKYLGGLAVSEATVPLDQSKEHRINPVQKLSNNRWDRPSTVSALRPSAYCEKFLEW